MNLYDYYRGQVDYSATYRVYKGTNEIRYKLDPGERIDSKGLALWRASFDGMPTGIMRVHDEPQA